MCINNGNIITEKYYYDTENWHDLKTGNRLDMASLDEETKNILNQDIELTNQEIGISMSVLTENLLKGKM